MRVNSGDGLDGLAADAWCSPAAMASCRLRAGTRNWRLSEYPAAPAADDARPCGG